MLVAVVTTAISLVLGTMMAYPLARMRFPGAGGGGHRGGRHLPRAATTALHPHGRHHQQAGAGQHADRGHAHVPHAVDPVLRVAAHGLLQERAAGAGGGGADRRGEPVSGHDPRGAAPLHARAPVRGDLRLHAGAERVPLRFDLPGQERGADGAGGRHHRADPRRRVLLGPAHGRRAPRLGALWPSSTRSSWTTTWPASPRARSRAEQRRPPPSRGLRRPAARRRSRPAR